MFQFIYNVLTSIFIGLYFMVIAIITGKQPKISIYHFDKNSEFSNLFDVCSDKYIKTNIESNVSKEAKRVIIKEFIHHLTQDENFHKPLCNTNFPLFDGERIIGRTNYYEVIDKSLKEYINKIS